MADRPLPLSVPSLPLVNKYLISFMSLQHNMALGVQLLLQEQHTSSSASSAYQVSYITRYVFSIHWYIDFAETYND